MGAWLNLLRELRVGQGAERGRNEAEATLPYRYLLPHLLGSDTEQTVRSTQLLETTMLDQPSDPDVTLHHVALYVSDLELTGLTTSSSGTSPILMAISSSCSANWTSTRRTGVATNSPSLVKACQWHPATESSRR